MIFEIPLGYEGYNLNNIELEFTARRKHNPGTPWDTDLHFLGIFDSVSPFTNYSSYTFNNSDIKLIKDNILDITFPNVDTLVNSEASSLIPFINEFYQNNPSYSGGRYLFLRFSPDSDPDSQAYRFYIYSANSSQYKPKLKFYFNEIIANPPQLFYKIKYGQD